MSDGNFESLWETRESMTDIAISSASFDDLESILILQKLAYQQEAKIYQDWSIPPLTQTLPEIQAEFGSCCFLKAEYSRAIVGSVRANLEGGTCSIGRLIVHPDFQHHGLGARLLYAIEEKFSSADRYELFTGARSEGNLRFYTKLGYRNYQTKFVSPGLTLIFLEKMRVIGKS
jgi:GNAT superfamily N-acetyltransferase